MAGSLIVVHPKHVHFYERSLGFVRIAEEKLYPTVENRPGVPLILDIARIDREHAEDYDRLFGKQIPQNELLPQPIPPDDREYFSRMVVTSDHPPVRQTELAGVPGTQSRGERRP